MVSLGLSCSSWSVEGEEEGGRRRGEEEEGRNMEEKEEGRRREKAEERSVACQAAAGKACMPQSCQKQLALPSLALGMGEAGKSLGMAWQGQEVEGACVMVGLSLLFLFCGKGIPIFLTFHSISRGETGELSE